MLLKKQEEEKYMTLRDKFIIDLNKELQIKKFEEDEALLRKKLKEMLKKGQLF